MKNIIKKMNNRGFAISGILYSLLILIILIMFLVLAILANRRINLNQITKDANEEINHRQYEYEDTGGSVVIVPGVGEIIEVEYSGACVQKTLAKGRYALEVWGAQGGSFTGSTSIVGGKGGYTKGEINLTATTTVWICVGGQPEAVNAANASKTVGETFPGGFNGGGEGITHRSGNAWTIGQGGGGGTDIRIENNSPYARVITAGGGSGATSYASSLTATPSYVTGYYGGGASGQSGATGYAGAATASGTATSAIVKGGFGVGASATTGTQSQGPAGAGGGWYGGATGTSTSLRTQHGGGSGFAYTGQGLTLPTGETWLISGYGLISANPAPTITAGNASMPKIDGSGNETGHTGNGFARITPIYDYGFADSCVEQQLAAGIYSLEVWGAQGGSFTGSTSTVGGKGGYSKGEITLTGDTVVYICVGGQPEAVNASTATKTAGILYQGGFNGGGNGITHVSGNAWTIGQGGGGGTDIRIGTPSPFARIITAGGGSGALAYNTSSLTGTPSYATGYYGGAASGQTGATGYAGTATASGTATSAIVKGGFVFGASATTGTQSQGPAGAGGGWYGGATGTSTSLRTQHGGGSGFGYTGQALTLPAGEIWAIPSYKLNATPTLTGGGSSMPKIDRSGNETGHSGNGYARITALRKS